MAATFTIHIMYTVLQYILHAVTGTVIAHILHSMRLSLTNVPSDTTQLQWQCLVQAELKRVLCRVDL